MSKFEDIIARVDEIKPNAFSADTKLSWLTSLNGKLAIDIFMMDIADVRGLPQGAAAIDCEPLVGFPHEEVYEEYLAAKIDAANGEASEYQNRMQIYDAYYTNFVGWFKATYDPVQGDPNCHGLKPKLPTYYITAYGLARMKGFTGTIEEWLASLKGEPGVSPTVTMVPIEGGHRITFEDAEGIHSFDVMDGTGNVYSVCGVLPDQTGNVPLTAEKVGARPYNWTPTAADVGARPDNWTPSADDVKALSTAGGSMTGPINMNGQALRGLNAPTADDQAVNWGSVKNAYGIRENVPVPVKGGGTGASDAKTAFKNIAFTNVTEAGTDLNDFIDFGVYFFRNATVTPLNIPVGTNGWLIVLPIQGNANVKQIWTSYGTSGSNDHMTYMRTGNGTTWGAWVKFITEKDNPISMDLLWENASPTSSFAAQTVNLDLNGYTHIIIEYCLFATTIPSYRSLTLKIGKNGSLGGAHGFTRWREFTSSASGVSFSEGKYSGDYGSDDIVEAAVCMPSAIYGIKGVST